MAVDDILKKIKADAEAAAQETVSGGKGEADEVIAAARQKIDAAREKMSAKARQRADEERNRIITLGRLSARRDLLSEKQGLIDRVFGEVRSSILGMGRDEYRVLIRGFLKDTVETGDEEVVLDERETRIDQAFLDEVSRSLGFAGKLRLSSERRKIGGGFILKSGRIETNCALDTILRDARDRLETDVAAILFGGNKR
jgi:V/A-type H+-transporting ATPase subunit E